jgi:hypothetical protein
MKEKYPLDYMISMLKLGGRTSADAREMAKTARRHGDVYMAEGLDLAAAKMDEKK